MTDNSLGFWIPPRHDLKWICVDVDNTLASEVWSPENPTSALGEPIWENVEKLHKAVEAGFKAILWTARPSTDYELIEQYCWNYQIPFSRIQTGKTLAAAYIDDKAINASAPSWIPQR